MNKLSIPDSPVPYSSMKAFAFIMDTGSNVEMADIMRSNGKIFVVVAVMLTILGGLIFYLIRLELKIKRLDREIRHKKDHPKNNVL